MAHIVPTPQIEQGSLSPHTSLQGSLSPHISPRLASPALATPRRPLAELDEHQLTQRHLHTPNHTPNHTPTLASSAVASPSLLLTTQLQPPGSLSQKQRQRSTERQLQLLQQNLIADLEQQRDDLENQLEDKDRQMESLKSSVASINGEYMTELTAVKQVVILHRILFIRKHGQ